MKASQRERAVPEKSVDSQNMPTSLEEQIAFRAYQLYEQRGRVDGFDLQDWAQAEVEVLNTANASKATA